MRDYASTAGCRMEYLRRQLDDPEAAPCGRCDRCTGTGPPTDVSPAALESARAALGRPGVEVEPRRMWPTGMAAAGVAVSGRIPAERQAAPGRALGRMSDLGWGPTLRDLLNGPDQEVPPHVFDGLVKVLAGWEWEERPQSVVAVPSRSHPRLVRSVAERIATVGRLPLLGELVRTRDEPPGTGRSNSAQRLRAVAGAFALPDGMQVPPGPVLLVDDRVDTGWTLTECARLLREAGAGAVLPLVLALDA